MFPQIPEFLLRYGDSQERFPVANHCQEWFDFDQTVVAAFQVRLGTAPRPLTRMLHQFRADGIQLHITRRRQQIRLVHDEGSKTSLPQIALPLLAEIDAPRVASMRLADGPPQAILGFRRRNQMDVIGHQAIAPNLDPFLTAPLGHQFDVGRVVLVVEKGLLSTVATLGDVVRQSRNH